MYNIKFQQHFAMIARAAISAPRVPRFVTITAQNKDAILYEQTFIDWLHKLSPSAIQTEEDCLYHFGKIVRYLADTQSIWRGKRGLLSQVMQQSLSLYRAMIADLWDDYKCYLNWQLQKSLGIKLEAFSLPKHRAFLSIASGLGESPKPVPDGSLLELAERSALDQYIKANELSVGRANLESFEFAHLLLSLRAQLESNFYGFYRIYILLLYNNKGLDRDLIDILLPIYNRMRAIYSKNEQHYFDVMIKLHEPSIFLPHIEAGEADSQIDTDEKFSVSYLSKEHYLYACQSLLQQNKTIRINDTCYTLKSSKKRPGFIFFNPCSIRSRYSIKKMRITISHHELIKNRVFDLVYPVLKKYSGRLIAGFKITNLSLAEKVIKEIEKAIPIDQDRLASVLRLYEGGQFTIYLVNNFVPEDATLFVAEINAILNSHAISCGAIPTSDIRINNYVSITTAYEQQPGEASIRYVKGANRDTDKMRRDPIVMAILGNRGTSVRPPIASSPMHPGIFPHLKPPCNPSPLM
jgi:hypothetical protein